MLMKLRQTSFVVGLLSGIVHATLGLASDDFTSLLKTGNELRQRKQFQAALLAFDSARSRAANDTQRGLAIGSQAEILAYHLEDYVSARKAAETVVKMKGARPVARVTGLKVLAKCLMTVDKDLRSAIKTLQQAAELDGVPWAQPEVHLMLGDCYRGTKQFATALWVYEKVSRMKSASRGEKATAFLNLGLTYQYGLRQAARASRYYSQALQTDPGLQAEVLKHHAPVRRALILAHYMPWYSAKPHSDRWGWHWTMNHFDPEKQTAGQRDIASHFYPRIGPYDSGDPNVLEYHLLLMKLAGIDGVIVDWYGRTDLHDYAILHRNTSRLLRQCERLKMKFAICYEDQTIPKLVEAGKIASTDRVTHALQELRWLNNSWFKSPSYADLESKPILLSFGHAGLTNQEWSTCLSRLGFPVAYFSQDLRREGALGGFGWPAPKVGLQQVTRFLRVSSNWPAAIPAAFPRFADIYREAGVHKGYPPLPDNGGRTFQSTLEQAFQSQARVIQIATWNDWGEGTQIEPSREFGERDLRVVQDLRRKYHTATFAPHRADLKMPGRILELRRAASTSVEQIDPVVTLLRDRKWEAARRAFRSLAVK